MKSKKHDVEHALVMIVWTTFFFKVKHMLLMPVRFSENFAMIALTVFVIFSYRKGYFNSEHPVYFVLTLFEIRHFTNRYKHNENKKEWQVGFVC